MKENRITSKPICLTLLICAAFIIIVGTIATIIFCRQTHKIYSPNGDFYIVVQDNDNSFIIKEFETTNKFEYRTTKYFGDYKNIFWSNNSTYYAVSLDDNNSNVYFVNVASGYVYEYDNIFKEALTEKLKLQFNQEIYEVDNTFFDMKMWSENDELVLLYFELSDSLNHKIAGYFWFDLEESIIQNLNVINVSVK